jgi:hypothetical protein
LASAVSAYDVQVSLAYAFASCQTCFGLAAIPDPPIPPRLHYNDGNGEEEAKKAILFDVCQIHPQSLRSDVASKLHAVQYKLVSKLLGTM